MLLLRLLHVFGLLSIVSASPTLTSKPVVEINGVKFQGAFSSLYNLNYFRKIPFAASTAGTNRFRPPQPPVIPNGIYDTDADFDMCPQRENSGSEDCLYLGVYSRPLTDSQPLRPVLLNFHSGGFVRGSATFNMPPPVFPLLSVSEQNDFVVVWSNYRTNVFGFLPGKKVADHKDVELNPGLLDQQAALQWIQDNIHHFGGDKGSVTISGHSSGGGSVIAQTIATGNKGKNLFQKAMATSPFWPKTYRYDSPQAEAVYQQTLKDVGCTNSADEIACLQKANIQALRDSATKLSTSQPYAASYFTYGPVIDDKFLTEPLSSVIKSGSLNAEFVQTSYNLHEGEGFIPPGLQQPTRGSDGFDSSPASFDAWLTGYLPSLTPQNIQALKNLYPDKGTAEELTYDTTFVRAGLVYRDSTFTCPAYWLSTKAANHGYLIDYTISPAQHTSGAEFWYKISQSQTTNALVYKGYAGAMASFAQTGDPNAHKLTDANTPGVPNAASKKQFLITGAGLRTGGIPELEARCAFWLEVGGSMPI